ncbi:MAG TPA: hypothetical protein VFH66_16250 [Mycobacteriales bacterium]|nr:hypothetical protein [Mycobacteriales bacterium]
MIVACSGDAVFILRAIRYDAWGRTMATGRGVQRYNDCQPNCASGHPINRPVRFRLFRLTSQGGATVFGCLVLDGGTDGTYTLVNGWPATRCQVPGHIAG